MKLKNALETLHQEHATDKIHPLYTIWGEQTDPEHVWEEYPRPQMHRDNCQILNGYWDYAITSLDAEQIQPGIPFLPDGQILVPFSPESLLSGVNRQLQPEEYLWYQKSIHFSESKWAKKEVLRKRCLLHFGAVDQQAEIFINGKNICSHIGGYLPFCADITDELTENANLVQVRVRDESDTSYYSRGKQTLKRGGMFYTAQSGIWQSVWIEWVPENYILSIKISPDYDNHSINVEFSSPRPFEKIHAKVFSPGLFTGAKEEIWETVKKNRPVLPMEINITAPQQDSSAPCLTHLSIHFPDKEEGPYPWTPDTPYLYPFTITADEDQLDSYFAMRTFTIEPDSVNRNVFCLNHSPMFLHGILDQGYWSDGLMTAPCDEAFLYDIRLARRFGFNMMRKHIKIEPLRWYYHCDRLGMLVWQDMVSGGTAYHMPLVCYLPTICPFLGIHLKDDHYRFFSRASQKGRLQWERECMDTVEHLYNIPSLAVWVPFNEGWGQFDALRICGLVKQKDPTRPVDHVSGWFDQKGGDFKSVHNYFRPLKIQSDPKRAFVISEYGGLACHMDQHSAVDRVYGYQKYDTCKELSAAFSRLMKQKLAPLREQGLSGAVYTQLSDVEEEVNGLVTYDRKVVKIIEDSD